MPTIEDTIQLIQKLHAGQVDKGGEPYWTHPLRVMKSLPQNCPEDWKHAALLHDVLEDTETTLRDLDDLGYSGEVQWIVNCLTRNKGDGTYFEYVEGIRDVGYPALLAIKTADVMDNLDPERLAKIPGGGESLKRRYEKALDILLGKFGEEPEEMP